MQNIYAELMKNFKNLKPLESIYEIFMHFCREMLTLTASAHNKKKYAFAHEWFEHFSFIETPFLPATMSDKIRKRTRKRTRKRIQANEN